VDGFIFLLNTPLGGHSVSRGSALSSTTAKRTSQATRYQFYFVNIGDAKETNPETSVLPQRRIHFAPQRAVILSERVASN
jgi:hypothetical protein